MKALLHQTSYRLFEPRPDLERPTQPLPRQPQGRTLSWQIKLSYPSPPMSSPPSPHRKLIDLPTTTSTFPDLNIVATATSSPSHYTAPLPPILAGAPAIVSLSSEPLISRLAPIGSEAPTPSLLTQPSTSSSEEQAPHFRTGSTSSTSAAVDVQPTAGPSTSISTSNIGQGGRRAKTHVANACNNCKRAHLSCDVERPCNRCVQTGKSDTCRDVPHKKRGRPRLRDEGDFRTQQHDVSFSEAGSGETGPLLARREMIGRHRRTTSLRTLRSHPDAIGPSVVAGPSNPALGPAFAPQPRARRLTQGFVTPTAFLDLDMVIMKANASFSSLMGVHDIRGMRLTDIARPLDGDSFQNTRNSLRAEREAKEPAYLPPILQPGLDPVSGITDQDIDEITRGFDDQYFTWTFRMAGGAERTLAVRLRLAKTSLYFVTLFLPPLPDLSVEQAPVTVSGPVYQIPPALAPPPSPFFSSPRQFMDSPLPGQDTTLQKAPQSPFYQPRHIQQQGPPTQVGGSAQFHSRSFPSFESQSRYQPNPPQVQHQQPAFQFLQPPLPPAPVPGIQERQAPGPSNILSAGAAGVSFITPTPYLQSLGPTRPRSETMESLGRHVQSRLRADSGVTTSEAVLSSPPTRPSGELSRSSSDDSASSARARGASPRKRRRINLDDVLHQR